ncbi:MAG: carbon starvation protein A, partial [Christensenellaceae bacterium]|nr:carbon starvation protein A [Christensenellaceae bacterium]
CVVLGMSFPLFFPADKWHLFIFFYIFIASVVPVWILLQPRDYLNSFLLVFMIFAAVIGIIVYNPAMNLNAFNGFVVSGKSMFPFLFVTIACGAVSGFHALVSSGTASKQIKNEKDMLPVSYGAMIVECLLAVVALVAVGFMASNGNVPAGTPAVIFANAVATFTEVLGMPFELATTLITLSVSAFALTSLDSVARVGRLAFQEFWLEEDIDGKDLSPFKRFLVDKYVATVATLVVAYLLAKVGYKEIWALFGSANQLLSALSLIACAVFLKSTNRNGKYLWIPMIIMLIITLSALVLSIYANIQTFINGTSVNLVGDVLQFVFGIALFILGVNVAYQGIKKLSSKNNKVTA